MAAMSERGDVRNSGGEGRRSIGDLTSAPNLVFTLVAAFTQHLR